MKDLNEFTKKDFENLPYFDDENWLVKCDSVVLLPTQRVHDSGYRYFEAIPCEKRKPLGRLHGYDVFMVDLGITIGSNIRIDCLTKSKLMRVILPNNNYCANTITFSAEESNKYDI